MKNLFILPSKKPSRLLKSQNNNFMIIKSDTTNWFEIILKNTYQNIYITNNDGLNENDYVITDDVDNYGKLFQVSWLKNNKIKNCYKVILTTDHDLIKNGVQAIDDEFLEWFIKHPSCGVVDVEWLDFSRSFFINIKKEEPYQAKTFKELFANTAIIAETDEFGNLNYKFKANMKEELLPKINLIDDWLEKNGDPEIAKQVEKEAKELCEKETLEEAAERFSKSFSNIDILQEAFHQGFTLGIDWQQEQDKKMYSIDDLKEAYAMGRSNYTIKAFNEKFKNK